MVNSIGVVPLAPAHGGAARPTMDRRPSPTVETGSWDDGQPISGTTPSWVIMPKSSLTAWPEAGSAHPL